MKPGHAPSERRNRQLPLVALQGLTYKEIWGNSSNPKTAPVSHTPAPLPLFPCASWSDDKCSVEGQWLWIPTKDRSLPCVRKLGPEPSASARPIVSVWCQDQNILHTLNYFCQENFPCIKTFWLSTQFPKQYRKQETSVKFGRSKFSESWCILWEDVYSTCLKDNIATCSNFLQVKEKVVGAVQYRIRRAKQKDVKKKNNTGCF